MLTAIQSPRMLLLFGSSCRKALWETIARQLAPRLARPLGNAAQAGSSVWQANKKCLGHQDVPEQCDGARDRPGPEPDAAPTGSSAATTFLTFSAAVLPNYLLANAPQAADGGPREISAPSGWRLWSTAFAWGVVYFLAYMGCGSHLPPHPPLLGPNPLSHSVLHFDLGQRIVLHWQHGVQQQARFPARVSGASAPRDVCAPDAAAGASHWHCSWTNASLAPFRPPRSPPGRCWLCTLGRRRSTSCATRLQLSSRRPG